MKVKPSLHNSESVKTFSIGPSDAHIGSALSTFMIAQGWKQASVITEQRQSQTEVTDIDFHCYGISILV